MMQGNNGKPLGGTRLHPRGADDDPTGPVAHEPSSGDLRVTAPKAPPPRVLVIDDSEVSRLALAEALLRAGCMVYQLPSAIGATRLILRHNVRAAIVDVNMPGLSGDKLISVLRTNPRLRDLAIIVVSGRSDVELDAIVRETGADAALEKSRIATELWPLLARIIGRSLERAGK